ncbi:MAG: FISUMP domain-containing protein, partial [bacterium]
GTTTTLSSSDSPGHGNFIINGTVSPYDWRSPRSDNLWQGISGVNNPCPSGFRIPTSAEWVSLANSITNFTAATCGSTSTCLSVAYSSTLKLPSCGQREYFGNSFSGPDFYGTYWANTPNGSGGAYLLFFISNNVVPANTYYRATGYSVRCIKD